MTKNKVSPARILLIDDHPAVRQGVGVLLESLEYRVAGEAGSRSETLGVLKDGDFELALLDLSLEDGSGLDLLADLTEKGIPALVYTMYEDPETIDRALRCGAKGYVTKREQPKALLKGVETVLQGGRFVSDRSARNLAKKDASAGEDPLFLLSGREREIFTAVGCGASNAEVAERLRISPRTVETYLTRIINKLHLESAPALRKFAIASLRTAPTAGRHEA